MKLSRIVVAVALACCCAAAHADLVTVAMIFASAVEVGAIYTIYVKAAVLIGLAVFGSVQQRRKARKAQAAARAAYNAALQDRSVSTLTAAPDWRIVYGRQIGGGDVVAIFTSDKTGTREDGTTYVRYDALKHLVVHVASHQVQAIHDTHIDGVPVGPLDGNGYPTGGEFIQTQTPIRNGVIGVGGTYTVPGGELAVSIVSAGVNSTDPVSSGQDYVDYTGSVAITGGGATITGPAGVSVNYTVHVIVGFVRIKKHLGTDTQTVDTYLNGLKPSQWTSNHRLRGLAYCVITLDLEHPRFQGGPPNFTFDVSGRLCFDNRTGLTVWTDNLVVCARDFLRSIWGYNTSNASIDNTTFDAAATACDVRVDATIQSYALACTLSATANTVTFAADRVFSVGDGVRLTTTGSLSGTGLATGTTYYIIRGDTDARRVYKLATNVANAYAGTAIDITGAGTGVHTCTWFDYRKYTCNGSFLTSESKEMLLEDFGESMGGNFTNIGKWYAFAGAWPAGEASVMDLTDDDLDGSISLPECDTSLENLINGQRGTYIPTGYAIPLEYDSYQNATFRTADGEDLFDDKNYRFVGTKSRCRNLARIVTEANRSGQSLFYPAKLRALPLQPGDRVHVTSAELGLSLKYYRVTDWQFGYTAPVGLGLIEDDSTIWDLADASSADPTPNTGLPNPNVTETVALSPAPFSDATTGIIAQDGTWVPRVKVSWIESNSPYMTGDIARMRIGWRYATTTSWHWADFPPDQLVAYIQGFKETQGIVIAAQFRNARGVLGAPVYVAHIVAFTQGSVGFVAKGVSGGVKMSGGQMYKDLQISGVASAWDSGMYSRQGAYAARVRFKVKTIGSYVIGLTTTPTASASYTNIDYGFYASPTGYRVYKKGTLVLADTGTVTAGDVCEVIHDGVAVRFLLNGALLWQWAAPSGQFVYFDSSWYTPGSRAVDVEFAPMAALTRGNLLDSSVWVIGTDGDQGSGAGGAFFNAETLDAENTIIHSPSPEGVLRPIWRALSSDAASSDRDGGFHTGVVPIDPSKTYRFSAWFRAVDIIAGAGQIYLGTAGSAWGNPDTVADIATGTVDTNPYLLAGTDRDDFVKTRWYLLTGFVLPSTIGTTPPSPTMGGIYDSKTGLRVASATRDYKWVSTASVATMRLFQNNTNTNNRTDFWAPRIEMCDGSEPTLDQLLAVAKPSVGTNLTHDFEAAFALNGQFTNWLLGATVPVGWANSAGTPTRETTITRTGPNAMRLISAGSTSTYNYRTLDFGLPLAGGSFVEGTLDCYLDSHTSGGYPGLLVRCHTNAGLSTQRDSVFNLPNTTADDWQTIPFKAAVNEGERIYGVTFLCMASYSALSGGQGVNNVVFDSLVAKAVQPSDTGHIAPDAATKIYTAALEAGPVTFSSIA